MPPRFTYWTIIFGNQPTAFRAATRDELLPTFKQIQSKHADAVMMWFARGRLWKSEEEMREAMFRRRQERAPRAEVRRARFGEPRPPSPGDRPPSSGDRRPPSGDRRPPSDDRRPQFADRRPPSSDRRPQSGDRPPSGDRRPPSGDRPTAAPTKRGRDWRPG